MKILLIVLKTGLMCCLPMLLWMLGAFILGWLLRHLFSEKPKIARLQADLDTCRSDHSRYKLDADAEIQSLRAKYEAASIDAGQLPGALSEIERLKLSLEEARKNTGEKLGLVSQAVAVPVDFTRAGEIMGVKIKQDDLKLVEGIGPKIERLFKDAGLKTWLDVAESTFERRKGILDAAGPHYQIHDPTTWGDQCRLMVEGRWEELKKWQDELVGGREV